MPPIDLSSPLPDDARVWVYAADRPLTADEAADLQRGLDAFLADWTSHRRLVQGSAELVGGRFLVLAATVAEGDISGCGIDKSVHLIEDVAGRHGFSWLDGLQVLYRNGAGTAACSRAAFRRLVKDGVVDASTTVYDLTVSTLGELRRGGIARPAGECWHARVFRIPDVRPA